MQSFPFHLERGFMSGQTRALATAVFGLVLSTALAQGQAPAATIAPAQARAASSSNLISPLAAQAAPARPAEIVQSGPPSSADAPHIDSVTLREERSLGRVYIIQEIFYYSPKGNAVKLHFELLSVSSTAARVNVRDWAIRKPKVQQQRGTSIVARFSCGRFQKNYSHFKRATIIDADGEHSNSVDFTVRCNLALIS